MSFGWEFCINDPKFGLVALTINDSESDENDES